MRNARGRAPWHQEALGHCWAHALLCDYPAEVEEVAVQALDVLNEKLQRAVDGRQELGRRDLWRVSRRLGRRGRFLARLLGLGRARRFRGRLRFRLGDARRRTSDSLRDNCEADEVENRSDAAALLKCEGESDHSQARRLRHRGGQVDKRREHRWLQADWRIE